MRGPGTWGGGRGGGGAWIPDSLLLGVPALPKCCSVPCLLLTPPPPPQAPWPWAGAKCTLRSLKSESLRINVSWEGPRAGAGGQPGRPPGDLQDVRPLPAARGARRVSPAAAKLLCSYSGFRSPRVEWKFAQGDTTSLVCYNSKITGESLRPTPPPRLWGAVPARIPGVGAPRHSGPGLLTALPWAAEAPAPPSPALSLP